VLAEAGYAVERSLVQAVELDASWGEVERATVFVLTGVLPAPAGGTPAAARRP
jgi:hypothetical protein